MNWPKCNSSRYWRSHYRQHADASLARLGIVAWRCEDCRRRFDARAVPLAPVRYAHCHRCGNFDLERVPNERLGGVSAGLTRYLGAHAYRCDPCRKNFVSWRSMLEPHPESNRSQGARSSAPVRSLS